MSNPISKLLLLAICSLSATSAMADTFKNECQKLSATVPTACSEIEKSILVYDQYKPTPPFLNTKDGQNFLPGPSVESSAPGTAVTAPSLLLEEKSKGSADPAADRSYSNESWQ